MNGILKKIVSQKLEEVSRLKAEKAENLLKGAEGYSRKALDMRSSLSEKPIGIIAEFKRKSPSLGYINEGANPAEIAPAYLRAGAGAASILTDGPNFGGSLADLLAARRAAPNLPLLRKEFILDFIQIQQAKAYGADAVLLIAAMLDKSLCAELSEYAHELGLQVLLEIHSARELSHVNASIDMLGVNNRNLDTFETSYKTSLEMAADLPDTFLKVSESGIKTPQIAAELAAAGYGAFLIGEAFMSAGNPAAALGDFISKIGEGK